MLIQMFEVNGTLELMLDSGKSNVANRAVVITAS
jgi:hypothetical protein